MCVCVSEVVFLLRFTFFFLLPFIESSAILLTCAVGFLSSFSFFLMAASPVLSTLTSFFYSLVHFDSNGFLRSCLS